MCIAVGVGLLGFMPSWIFLLELAVGVRWWVGSSLYRFPWWKLMADGGSGQILFNKTDFGSGWGRILGVVFSFLLVHGGREEFGRETLSVKESWCWPVWFGFVEDGWRRCLLLWPGPETATMIWWWLGDDSPPMRVQRNRFRHLGRMSLAVPQRSLSAIEPCWVLAEWQPRLLLFRRCYGDAGGWQKRMAWWWSLRTYKDFVVIFLFARFLLLFFQIRWRRDGSRKWVRGCVCTGCFI